MSSLAPIMSVRRTKLQTEEEAAGADPEEQAVNADSNIRLN